MYADSITSDPYSIYASQNELRIIETLNEETDLNIPTRDITIANGINVKPDLLYTVHGTNLNENLYKKIVVNCVERMKRTNMTNNFSYLLSLTSYFLLQNENLGKTFLCSIVKDTLIPLISDMDVEYLNIFWEAMKKRINLSMNHCIDGNNSRRRYLPLREPIKHNIPVSLDLFVSACLLELQRIQHHQITEQLTLKHVLCVENDYLLYKLMRKEMIGASFLGYCKRFSKYTRFKEIIEEQLRRVTDRIFLMHVLEDTCIHTIHPGNRNRIISLKDDCVKCVVEYLKNDDIRNMVVAYKTSASIAFKTRSSI